jgi:hypothetical protein
MLIRTSLVIIAVSAAMMFPFAGTANAASSTKVVLSQPMRVGTAQVPPGKYKVVWNGSGPAVEARFIENGHTVATAPARIRKEKVNYGSTALEITNVNSPNRRLTAIDMKGKELVFNK